MTLFTLQAENRSMMRNIIWRCCPGLAKVPQDFVSALDWAWSAQLGGITDAEELTDGLADILPEEAIAAVRESVATRLQARIVQVMPLPSRRCLSADRQEPTMKPPISGIPLQALGWERWKRGTMHANVEDERSSNCRLKLARFMNR